MTHTAPALHVTAAGLIHDGQIDWSQPPAAITAAEAAARLDWALEAVGLPTGVTTDMAGCTCRDYDCFVCAAVAEADEEADLVERGLTVTCGVRGCWMVARTHCGVCRTCRGADHTPECQYVGVMD